MNFKGCFSIKNDEEFEHHALTLFYFQAENIPLYKEYLKSLKINAVDIINTNQIPFLPVSFFKTHTILAQGKKAEIIFGSSGTTGMQNSHHNVADVSLYEQSSLKGFQRFYGNPEEYCILALLPSYHERKDSSLIYMAERLIEESAHPQSGFYLNQYIELSNLLAELRDANQKTILLGVSFALLELAEKFPIDFPELIIMETGGMKGRRKEMVREELHAELKKGFNVNKVHSEYGMTELLSQAYSKGEGIFECPPWMKILIRDVNDPFRILNPGATGGINVIDLANAFSCAFISTQDLGKLNDHGKFEVLGRFDDSDLRGCNLLVQ